MGTKAALRRSYFKTHSQVLALILLVQSVFRVFLCVFERSSLQEEWRLLPEALFLGLSRDALFAFFLAAPLFYFVFRAERSPKLLAAALFSIFFCLFCFTGMEWAFWYEFHSRFNFIAVDYLIYTGEVFKNAWESYPLLKIALGLGILAIAAAQRFLRSLDRQLRQPPTSRAGWPLWKRTAAFALLAVFALAGPERRLDEGVSYKLREIQKNGLLSFVHAARSNSLDYRQFYVTDKPSHEVLSAVKKQIAEDWMASTRGRTPSDAGKKRNVVLVLMESMSARFMRAFGNEANLTPNLDRLAREGLFFSKMYSTGTRTVRGLEALMLSIPPTPGQSIVRRPLSDGLFNLGTPFQQKGYDTSFIYGGYAVFDNMRGFFEGNGFRIVDRSVIDKKDITFATGWGACDEDIFNVLLKEADRMHAEEKPFFQFLLTTSNHRPYTYPSGRIEIPSGSSREGAVQYSDYAIGRFLEKAARTAWYKNTIFIFVADHNASVAGRTDLPPNDFRIPLIFFQPGLIAPKNVSALTSQMDFAPTLFGLLGFKYEPRFFGVDQLRLRKERAFIATYEKLGLLKDGKLTVLAPNRKVESYRLLGNGELQADAIAPDLLQDAITSYEGASLLFASGALKKGSFEFQRVSKPTPR